MSKGKTRQPTLWHVAKLAGVSKSTVAAVLRGETDRFADSTVGKVQQAAQQLGYRTSAAARSLRSGTGLLIGCVIDPNAVALGERAPQTVFGRAMLSFTAALSHHEAAVVLVMNPVTLRSLPFDALLSIGQPGQVLPHEPLPFGIPVIGLAQPEDDPRVAAYIYWDYGAVTQEALAHLAERGARRIAMVTRPHTGPDDPGTKAYLEWCGGRQDPIGIATDGSVAEIEAGVRDAVLGGADAIFTVGGDVRSVLDGIAAAGKSSPADVMVVAGLVEGAVEESVTPTVTSIAGQARANGELVAAFILDVCQGRSRSNLVLPTELVERESTNPPFHK